MTFWAALASVGNGSRAREADPVTDHHDNRAGSSNHHNPGSYHRANVPLAPAEVVRGLIFLRDSRPFYTIYSATVTNGRVGPVGGISSDGGCGVAPAVVLKYKIQAIRLMSLHPLIKVAWL